MCYIVLYELGQKRRNNERKFDLQSLSSSAHNFLTGLGGSQAKAARIALNNAALKRSILQVWGAQPEAAKWLLAQINTMFIDIDKAPRKKSASPTPPAIMVLKVRDALARAEFNARRESLHGALAGNGIHVEEIKLAQAGRDDKQHRLYSDAEIESCFLGQQSANPATANKAQAKTQRLRYADQVDMLETVRRAICLSFDDPDEAYTTLSMVEGAYLNPLKIQDGRRNLYRHYRVHFYVSDEAVNSMRALLSAYQDTFKSNARKLGLYITGFNVYTSPAELHGKHAFPRAGYPVPYLK